MRSWRSTCIASTVFVRLIIMFPLFFVVEMGGAQGTASASINTLVVFSKGNTTTATGIVAGPEPRRKLLQSSDGDGSDGDGGGDGDQNGGDNNRIGTECSKDDITINQGETAPLPSGIPAYTVQILNMCASGCSISDIHISCGWFSSAQLVNPRVFRRMDYDDCLVNDGQPLGPGQTLSFQYANTFRYPLVVSSVSCLD